MNIEVPVGPPTAGLPTRPSTAAFAAAVLGVSIAVSVLGVWFTPPVLVQFAYSDFGTFYRAAASGHLYGPDASLPVAGPATFINLNPPHFHLLFRPLTLLPMADAYILWLVLTGSAIGIGLWKSARRVRVAWPWWMWAVILAWTPTFSLVYTGQITALIFVPLVLAWWADREGRPGVAGAWLGLAVSVKPHLALLLIYWVFRGRWRSLAMATLSGGVSALCGVAAYGWSVYGAWLSNLRAASWPWAAMNCSLWALPSRLWHETPYYAKLAESPALVMIATLVLVAPVALATLGALRKVRCPDTSWALALCATMLVMPLGWAYNAWWWAPITMGLPLSRRTWAIVAVCMMVPVTLLGALTRESILLTITLGSAPVYGMFVLWASILRLALAESRLRGRDRSLNRDAPI